MFSIMLFIFLCFFGILAVLFHMLRSQERLFRILRDEHAQMRVLLRAMESRLDALDGTEPQPTGSLPAHDPLLRLSFEGPAANKADSGPAVDPALDLHFDPPQDKN